MHHIGIGADNALNPSPQALLWRLRPCDRPKRTTAVRAVAIEPTTRGLKVLSGPSVEVARRRSPPELISAESLRGARGRPPSFGLATQLATQLGAAALGSCGPNADVWPRTVPMTSAPGSKEHVLLALLRLSERTLGSPEAAYAELTWVS